MTRLQQDMRRLWIAGTSASRQFKRVPSGSQRAAILMERCRDLEYKWRYLNAQAKMLEPLYSLIEKSSKKGGSE